jgi:hypothetical protein
VNVDVALAKNFDRSAVAAVARDETGIFFGSIGACSGWTNQPEVLETIACREDMALASDLVLQKIRVGGGVRLYQCGEEYQCDEDKADSKSESSSLTV